MLQLKSIDLEKDPVEALIIPVSEGKTIHDNRTIQNLITKTKKLKEFSGKTDESVTLYDAPRIAAQRIILIGMGPVAKIGSESLRAFAGSAVKEGILRQLSRILLAVPSTKRLKGIKDSEQAISALMEGAVLANHVFDKYRQEKKQKPLKQILLLAKPDLVKKHRRLQAKIKAICQGTILARDWVSTPSNDKRPEQFARTIMTAAGKVGLKKTLWDEKRLKREKFGALLAVAAGSSNKPRMVVLEYKAKSAKKTVALVGKGVTFDSGGINLKVGGGVEIMKIDMSGAAAVAATMITIAKLKPAINVIGIMPIVENMPSGSATRPGDVVKSYAGKTIEIGNTDAEGRLILVDAMAYAVKKYAPDAMLDLATLTGACMVALGEDIAGVFSSDDKLAKMIVDAGQKTHERCWHMPLPTDYKDSLKSDIADMNNMSSSRYGGAITAALFLSDFVGKTRWAHIDIAGPAHSKKGYAYCPAGGTGFGVRLLCELLDKL